MYLLSCSRWCSEITRECLIGLTLDRGVEKLCFFAASLLWIGVVSRRTSDVRKSACSRGAVTQNMEVREKTAVLRLVTSRAACNNAGG